MAKRKSEEEVGELEKNYTNVKCGLRTKCLNKEVFNKIQIDVEQVSALSVECSRYIHFSLMKKWGEGKFEKIKFLDYYYHLFEKKLQKYKMDTEYADIRNNNNLTLFEKSYKSNLVIDAANRYETLFHNNIWMHSYRRIKKFLNQFDKNNYDTMHFLFYKNTDKIPNDLLLEKIKDHLKWNGKKFYNITYKTQYFEHIKFFYTLQRYNEENNLKNFNLIPILKFGRHHVRYDSFALWQLLRSINLCTGSWKHFDQHLEWRKYFKTLETKNKHFENSIMTDGVAISFLMGKDEKKKEIKSKKPNKQNHEDDVFGNIAKIKENINSYDTKIGLDPGLKLIVGGVKNNQPIKIKSSRFRHMTGVNTRKLKLKKWTTNSPNTMSPMSKNFEEYTNFELSIFNSTQNEFMQRKVARLKLQKYICVEKASYKLAKEIIGDGKNTKALVVIGSTKIASNSPMKGYIRTPQPKLLKALKTYSDVLEVGEFRTTKLCSNCYNELITSLSPHRYQFCKKCGITWNRDVNAGKNLLYLGLCQIHGVEIHENFKRTTILSTTKKKTANVKSLIVKKCKGATGTTSTASTITATTVSITQSTTTTSGTIKRATTTRTSVTKDDRPYKKLSLTKEKKNIKPATTTRTRVTDDTTGSSSTTNDDSKATKFTTTAEQIKKQLSKTDMALSKTTSTNPSPTLKTSDIKSIIGEKCKAATGGTTTLSSTTQATTITSGTIKRATTTRTSVTKDDRPYKKLSLTKEKKNIKPATTTRTRVTDDTTGSSSTTNDDSKATKFTTTAEQIKKQLSKTDMALSKTTSTNPSPILKTSDIKSIIGEKCKAATGGTTTLSSTTQATTITSGTIKRATTTRTSVTKDDRPYKKLSLTKDKMNM